MRCVATCDPAAASDRCCAQAHKTKRQTHTRTHAHKFNICKCIPLQQNQPLNFASPRLNAIAASALFYFFAALRRKNREAAFDPTEAARIGGRRGYSSRPAVKWERCLSSERGRGRGSDRKDSALVEEHQSDRDGSACVLAGGALNTR